ncbi:MAG TPA: ankyrin repeat domain-containing protein [Chthonomonadaceae bacterium]|nr:ankyrin repeat domain-containing protein [Chthonomonadaceae bacterium]
MKHFRFRGLLAVLSLFLLPGALPANGPQDQEPKTPEDRLLRAVDSGDKETILALLNRGINPNAPNSYKTPPLVAAARRASDEDGLRLLRLLVEHGAEVNGTDSFGDTPLISATTASGPFEQQGPIQAIEYLLSRGADINHKDSAGATALSWAMTPGRNQILRTLLAHGADIYDAGPKESDYTPLHYVACGNDTARVKMLLQKGENANAKDGMGRTPLILAAEGGSVDTLQALLDAGADVNAKDLQNNTALLVALHSQSPDAALLLVQRGADVNACDAQKDTPFLLALQLTFVFHPGPHSPNEDAVFIHQTDTLIAALLAKGADVNATGYADSPLIVAIRREMSLVSTPHVNWVTTLLEHGAEPNSGGPYYTPLSATIDPRRHSLELPTLLLDHGADINSAGMEVGSDRAKVTVLLAAMQQQDFALAKLLIERGANVECYDSARKTPLLWAAYDGQMELVKLLLVHGANLHDKDVMGQNALMLARKGGHPELATFLQQRGVKTLSAPVVSRNALGQVVVRMPLTLHPDAPKSGSVTFAVRDRKDVPVLLLQRGETLAADPVAFGNLLTDPSLWSEAERNNIHYQIQRSYYAPDAYQFFGLVQSGGETYLGVFWYSPSASAQNQVASFVFRLRFQGTALELTVAHKAGGDDLVRASPYPALRRSPEGTLLLTDENGAYVYQPDTGAWKKLGGHGR